MQLIKLDAIDSTNDFLKALSADKPLENFTIVTAENQTKGKGQMGAKWESKPGKNLVMSILYQDLSLTENGIYDLNVAVATAVITALKSVQIPALSIKWPNDIMAGSKKIGGILIENTLKPGGEVVSIIGIGLNVNQVNFEGLPKASSLAAVCGKEFDKAGLLEAIVSELKKNVLDLKAANAEKLWSNYLGHLFRKGIPMPFQTPDQVPFMAIAETVTRDGKLELRLEDDSIRHYGIKEIQMLF